VPQDPPDDRGILDEGDEPQPASAPRTREHVKPARLRAKRFGEASPEPRRAEAGTPAVSGGPAPPTSLEGAGDLWIGARRGARAGTA
jgi:hypothetical protein